MKKQRASGTRRKSVKKSHVWDHYDEITDAEGVKRAKCKHCSAVYVQCGTTNLLTHLKKHVASNTADGEIDCWYHINIHF